MLFFLLFYLRLRCHLLFALKTATQGGGARGSEILPGIGHAGRMHGFGHFFWEWIPCVRVRELLNNRARMRARIHVANPKNPSESVRCSIFR